MDPPLAPTVRGLAGPPAAPSDHWYGGLGGSLGESEAWKPQKVGGCGWTWCPRNSFLSHVAQDTARAWFRGAHAHCAVFGAFWRLFGPFLGHIVELKGTKGPLVTRKSSCTWSVATVSLRLEQWVKNGSKTCFPKNDPRPFMMLKQVVLAHFEPVATGLGSCKIPKCLEMGHFGAKNGSKMGQKGIFPKVIPEHLGCSNKCFLPVLSPF